MTGSSILISHSCSSYLSSSVSRSPAKYFEIVVRLGGVPYCICSMFRVRVISLSNVAAYSVVKTGVCEFVNPSIQKLGLNDAIFISAKS